MGLAPEKIRLGFQPLGLQPIIGAKQFRAPIHQSARHPTRGVGRFWHIVAKNSVTIPEKLTRSALAHHQGTNSVIHQPFRIGYLHELDPSNHYSRSQATLDRIPLKLLRSFADTIPAQAAMTRIVNGLLGLDWNIEPPKEEKESETAAKRAQVIKDSILNFNYGVEGCEGWQLSVRAMVEDMLTQNVTAIERKPGKESSGYAFWLWTVDPDRIRYNLEWTPDQEGLEPRYYDTNNSDRSNEWIPLYNDDLFLFRLRGNTWRSNPPGPLEIAFKMVCSWLGLADFQQQTTSRASAEYLLDLGQVTEDELEKFRQYFKYEVKQQRDTPIFGKTEGAGEIRVVKLGAANDSGLYLQYQEYILRMIALAFQLSVRDMNITEHDNRATADVAADTTFQFAILPLAEAFFSKLQREVVDFYAPGYTVKLADTQPRDQMAEAQTADILYKGGIIRLNEARTDVGKEPIGPEGEKFINGDADDPTKSQEPPPGTPMPGVPGQPPVDGQPPDGKQPSPPEGNQPPPGGKVPPDASQKTPPLDGKKTSKKKPPPGKKGLKVAASARLYPLQLPIWEE